MPDLVADACARAVRFEEQIPYLYLDNAHPPNVTAGAGHVLRSAEEASRLFGCDMSIQFAKVASCAGGHMAPYYAQFTGARLTARQIATQLTQDMAAKLTELTPRMPGWPSLPYNVQLACLDMAFNCGVWGLVVGFPRFMEILESKPLDLRRLAVESKRNEKDPVTRQLRELNPPRNAEIAALILSAGQAAAA